MLFKLAPQFVKNRIKNFIKAQYHENWQNDFIKEWDHTFLEQRKEIEKSIPKYDLQHKHIGNLTVLLNREEMLKKMPQEAICAEIGVNEGEFSSEILDRRNPKKLHLIDAWGDGDRYHDRLKIQVEKKFENEIQNGKIEINHGYSTVVLKTFPDLYFDWVYLDTDHSYQTTAQELTILKQKVKVSGIIAGHDYIIGNWVGNCRYGVIEAVHEFCVMENWELLYLTANKNEMPSFAIRRIL